ncbi:MAG: MoxR family ATPase, partial [Planctomycetaceae bacterium]|nr:MoxR family ATPase [Planctomycetaceae bacterium]
TVSGHQYDLPDPFFVMATQNPIEQEGTYPLPIAALDRFLFKVHVDYPDSEEELNMLLATTSRGEQEVQPVVTKEQVVTMLRTVREIHIAEDTMEYAVRLVRATRPTQSDDSYIKEMVETGGSPRAVQALILGGKAHAALDGRDEAMPKDLRSIIHPALRHRVVPSFHANADGINSDQLIDYVVEHTARPRNDKTETVVEKRPFNLMRWLLGEPKPRKRAISLQPNV